MSQVFIPPQINRLITDKNGQPSTFPFPPNIADLLNPQQQQEILRWLLQKYIWPQIMDRKAYEAQWDELLSMARASWHSEKLYATPESRLARAKLERRLQSLQSQERPSPESLNERCALSDTIIFDAVDRLTNLNHFISFKEKMPVKFAAPRYGIRPAENDVYHPFSDLVRSANGLLEFNAKQADFYLNHIIAARHFYTYGVAYVSSEFQMEVEPQQVRYMDGPVMDQMQLTKFCTSFDPISVRKLWLDYRLTTYKMEYQPCPFMYDTVPPFAIVANPYSPDSNPFGFQNLDKLQTNDYIFSDPSTESLQRALQESNPNASLSSLLPPELQIGLLWTFYPMIPLGWNPDGTMQLGGNAPMQRYIVQAYGHLHEAKMTLLRFQPSFYGRRQLPIYGAAQMPDTDSGAYPPAIGTILRTHYIQLTTALEQYLENKEWINDPPTSIVSGSPAINQDVNRKGAKIEVLTHNDISRREPLDGTQTTPAFIGMVREQAKTSSKAVDAILGQAMGSRTSATEASNAFQSAMSGVTTDINIFNHSICGGYAERVWDYMGRWADPDVIYAITGSFGFAIRPEHFSLKFEIEYDVGSSYIESIVRQGNIRYLLESTIQEPSINRPALFRALLREWKFENVDEIVNDNNQEYEIRRATEQAILTFMGNEVYVNPDQNHDIAIRVKSSFLEDRNSVWMTDPTSAPRANMLIQQIQIHQQIMQMQMMQQMMQMQSMMGLQSLQSGGGMGMGMGMGAQLPAPGAPPLMAGDLARTRTP